MSISSSRHRRPTGHIAKHTPKQMPPSMQNRSKRLLLLIVVAILAAIPFSMGKYFELNSPGPFDSGAYVYSAKHVLEGARIGTDEIPSAQVGTLLVNMLGVWLFGFSDAGPKLIQMFLQASALILMFIAMQKLFGTLSAAIGVIVASVYLSSPLIAKFGNVKEQYMIACMVIGISCFVLYQLGGKWWLACLAGAFVAWAPLFKETGFSVIGAVGLFVIAQPLLRHRSWKKTGADILLLLAGAVISISPICLWLASQKAPMNYFPYSSLWKPIVTSLQNSQDQSEPKTAKAESDINDSAIQTTTAEQGLLMKFLPSYVRDSWQILKPEQIKQAKLRVFRWYRLLILPIALALGSIIIRIVRISSVRLNKSKSIITTGYDRFVLLFAVWWFLDMAFIWISPRSYDQYYLPLNASAAMLGGYLIAIYYDKVKSSAYKNKWVITGLVGLLLMIIMSWHIFFGIEKSPHSGISYGGKTRGYVQKLKEVSQHPQYSWKMVGEYIRTHSEPTDKIYVWGWFPGIYVQAQRFSSAVHAFTSEMHIRSPKALSEMVAEVLDDFEKKRPKFIVDTRKRHFPWNRPPLELWPIAPKGFMGMEKSGFLSLNKDLIGAYDKACSKWLRKNFDEDEALRYEAMQPFREFVMNNYQIVRMFGQHILFELKISKATKVQ
jgi:hypothetical protein